MAHPDPNDIRKAMGKLQIACDKYPGSVNMGCVQVTNHGCGTVACHAGWYALACSIADDTGYWERSDSAPVDRLCADDGTNFGFTKGMYLLTRDLKFNSARELEHWADRNPHLWGNRDGDTMFASRVAFGIELGETITVQNIVDHWLKVADRIEALSKPGPELGSWKAIKESTGWAPETSRSTPARGHVTG